VKPLTLKPFRAGYLCAAAVLSVAAAGAAQSPGLGRALARFGTDTQLPLERIASGGHLVRHLAGAQRAPRAHASLAAAAGTPAAAPNDALHRSTAHLRLSRRGPGYWRALTETKDWT
jgi:hypothetical protein